MGMEFNWPVRVYIEDTDAGGIVYYVNYLKFMERARTEFLRYLGFDHAEMINQGRMFVIHSANTRYLQPAVLDDELQIGVAMSAIKRSSVTFRQRVLRAATQEVLAQTEICVVCVVKESMKPCAIEAEMIAALQAYI
jgi:4-hydroxybenzoyl-CoA thioesterase